MNQLRTLGIIMDGNRRFARARGWSSVEGHRRGASKIKEVLGWARSAGIKTVFLYAFSTENWRRSKTEVAALMLLFRRFLKTEVAALLKEGTRLVFIGELAKFPRRLQTLMAEAMAATRFCRQLTLVVAVSYGGRAEILAAAKVLAQKYAGRNGNLSAVGESEFSQGLWTAGLPDPDLIIRTGGARRLSNFLAWQSVYSELHFTKTFWPALTRTEFETILADYRTRDRRFGR